MSERDHPTSADSDAAERSPRSSKSRIAIEFALLFAVALVLKQFLPSGNGAPYPNPLWLPVIVLSLEHGLATGLAATIIASGLHFSGGLPPMQMTEDIYAYISRIAAEPVSWACVALLIGHIRSQQIVQVTRLQADLAERNAQCAAVADLCVDLRDRADLLERHIAANALASNVDIAEAMRELNDATWDSFAERLTRFVTLMTGTAEFSVYLLRDDVLRVVFQPNDEHTAAGDVTIAPDDPLFGAVVKERRILSAMRAADRLLLGERGVLAGPLADNHAPNRVIGMFAIGGGALADHPEDIERRFSLTLSEIARVLGRIILIENWHAAAAPGQSNGHDADEREAKTPQAPKRAAARPGGGKPRPDEMTLQ